MRLLRKIIGGMVVFLLLSSMVSGTSFTKKNDKTDYFKNITLDFTFPQPVLKKVMINNKPYDQVTIGGLPNSDDIYKSYLPVKPVKILIPYCREIDSIDVVAKEKSSLKLDNAIGIRQGKSLVDSDLTQHLSKGDHAILSSSTLYSIIGTHIFRGYSILFLNLYPVQVQYVEDTGELIYYKHLTLKITTKSSQSVTSIRGFQRDEDIVTKLVDNPSYVLSYDAASISTSKAAAQYVIITDEHLAHALGEYTFQNLTQSKIDKGISADIFTVEEIVNNSEYFVNGTWGDNNPDNPFYQSEIIENYEMFNDTQAKIRNFIRYAYMELGTDYVLLGGDADGYSKEDNIVPVRKLYACENGLPLIGKPAGPLDFEEDNIPSDIYYACLDGNFNYDIDGRWGENASDNDIADVDEADLLAEVYVGRACVDSDDEVSNFVMKTLGYENSDDDPYLEKVLMVGEYLGFPGVSSYGGNYMDLIIPSILEVFNVDTLYERNTNWNKYDIMDILDKATPHIINHLGHGFVDYALQMHDTDISSLTNNRYFFIYSQTCLAGSLDNCYRGHYYEDDCAAEYFTVETSHGAFAVIMNARFGLGSQDTLYSPSQIVDESFFKALFKENIRELGRANHYSKEDHIWHINENGIRWVYYETNLLGDPEISIKDPGSSNIKLAVNITHPENEGSLYVLNRKICSIPIIKIPVILGRITVKAEVSSDPEGQIYNVEFYLDNTSQIIDSEPPYEWETDMLLSGRHMITAEVHGLHGEKESEVESIIIFAPYFGGNIIK